MSVWTVLCCPSACLVECSDLADVVGIECCLCGAETAE